MDSRVFFADVEVHGGMNGLRLARSKAIKLTVMDRPEPNSFGAVNAGAGPFPGETDMRDLLGAPILLLLTATAVQAAEKAAVFDFQLANLGAQPPTQADYDRLPRVSDELRQELAKSGLYDIVSTASLKEEVDKSAALRSCGGCAGAFAKKLGADVAITGEIQKVSNLILNLNVYIKDVDGDKPEKGYSVDMRGDTDESFDRAVKYIVLHNILGK